MPLGVRFPRLLHLSPYDTRSTSMYSSRSGIYCTDRSRSRTAVVAVFSVASITFGCLLLERVTMLFCWRCVACQPRGETSGERTGQWWNSWWWEDVERRRSGRSANKRACSVFLFVGRGSGPNGRGGDSLQRAGRMDLPFFLVLIHSSACCAKWLRTVRHSSTECPYTATLSLVLRGCSS